MSQLVPFYCCEINHYAIGERSNQTLLVSPNTLWGNIEVSGKALSGPDSVAREATVAEMDAQGKMTVLRPGTNQWICVPGNENTVGQADMSSDPMGLRWMLDIMAKKPKPSNPTPGLIYMLNRATRRSYTDPFDRTSPPIPMGPHWMIIIWPFDPNAAGLPAVMRGPGLY